MPYPLTGSLIILSIITMSIYISFFVLVVKLGQMKSALSKWIAIISLIHILIGASINVFNVSPITAFALCDVVLFCIGFLIYYWPQARYLWGFSCYFADIHSENPDKYFLRIEGF